jgi:site-specific recombinase XerD
MVYIKGMMKQTENLRIALQAMNMSDRSSENYYSACDMFFNWLEKNKLEINRDTLFKYHAKLKNSNYSTASMKMHACAIRYYLKNVLNRNDLIAEMPSIRQVSKLPVILSKEEVKELISKAGNKIHETFLLVLYTCGLRLKEFENIRMMDIDFYRKNILIHGKGRKDRFVPVIDEVLAKIKENFSDLKPKDYLYTSMDRTHRLSSRTIGNIINQCAAKAGINKRVYPHLLRHSYATHCLEDGIDIRYIQLLLGHSSILATSQYTHVASMPEIKNRTNLSYLFN